MSSEESSPLKADKTGESEDLKRNDESSVRENPLNEEEEIPDEDSDEEEEEEDGLGLCF